MFLSLLLNMNLSAPETPKIAEIYAPIIVHDSRETSPLSSVEELLKTGPTLEGDCVSSPPIALPVFRFTENLLLKGSDEECDTLALNFHQARPKPVAKSYYHIIDTGLYIQIQYWLFYAWNETAHLGGGDVMALCGNHEGDWEHVSVRINRDKLSAAKSSDDYRNAIDDLYFAQHQRSTETQRKYLRRNDKRLSFKNAQVYIFSARGSHASYPSTGTWPLLTVAGITLRDENDGKGLTLDLANALLEPVINTPWFAYAGHWGAIVDNICTPLENISRLSNDGPFGPGHKDKFLSFYQGDWHDQARAMDF
jgi:hypothetical protein